MMDPSLAQVLLGVLTNIFSSTLERSVADIADIDLDSAFETARRDLFIRLNVGEGLDRDVLVEFLEGREVAATLRMLFISSANKASKSRTEIESEFQRAFATRFGDQLASDGERIFLAFSQTMEAILQVAASNGSTEAGGLLDSFRFRYLKEELAGLKASIEDLKRPPMSDSDEMASWDSLYRSQVQARHGTIVPPSLDTSDRVPIDEIYLAPTFRPGAGENTDDRIRSTDLISRLSRAVILGDPGAGKSTFALKLAYDLAAGSAKVPGGSLTPFFVDLKEYGAEKERNRLSIVDWLERLVSSDYAAPSPSGMISYLLSSGRAVVIFDGLDELLDTSHRKQITADVETFASRYVAAPILVTSRRVGYPQAPLDQRRFVAYQLNELDEDQIERYASVWFGRRRELTAKDRSEMAAGFLADSEVSAVDLRRNMLMLGLLCNLYRGEGDIPRHRPQVYEKCAVMLFERWDKGRKIKVELEFERHLRPAMQHLAFWIYSEPSLRGGVSEPDLIKSAAKFLLGRRFEDQDEARHEARRFVEFCRGRAWVFTDTGTTAAGDRLYQFTHRTFLEFFAAEHLVRTNASPEALMSVLGPRIAAGEWDVVAELACQIQDDNIDEAGDALLEILLLDEPAREDGIELRYNFAARSLGYLVPSREVCRRIARVVTRQTALWLIDPDRDELIDRLGSTLPIESHHALVRADRENFDPVAQEMVAEARRFLEEEGSNTDRALAAADIAANADLAVRATSRPHDSVEQFTAKAWTDLWPSLGDHVERNSTIAYDAFWFGTVGIEVLLSRYSVAILFDSRDCLLYDVMRPSLISAMIKGQVAGMRRPSGATIGDKSELLLLGEAFEASLPPWDTRGIGISGLASDIESMQPRDNLRGAALYGAFGALAWLSEHMFHAGEVHRFIGSISGVGGWIGSLEPFFKARYQEDQAEYPTLDCDERARIQIDTWASGGWSVVTPPSESARAAMRAHLLER